MTKLLPKSEWKFDKVQDEHLPICFYYEFGRSSDNFKKRVQKWRDRHRDYMDGARRFLACKGPLKFCFGKPFSKSNPAPKGKEHAEAVRVYKALEDWLSPFSRMPSGEDEKAVFLDRSHPDGLASHDPRNFLYRFPPFPDCSWQKLSKEKVERARRIFIFIDDSSFPFPPVVAKRPDRQPKPEISLDYPRRITCMADLATQFPSGIFGTPLWQFNQFIEESALMESDTFTLSLTSYALDKEEMQLWAGGYCHEKVHFIVNWAKSNSEIKKAFTKWLGTKKNGRRPHHEFRRANVATIHETLHQLGAYRVLKMGISAKQAYKDYPLYNSKNNDPAEAANQFGRAAGKAEKLLDKLFPSSFFDKLLLDSGGLTPWK